MSQKVIDMIRLLSAEQVQEAYSGHPGLPLGAAPIAYTLYGKCMNHCPGSPGWINRDRFVLSAGHGSALLYSVLHLMGYNISLEDLKQFRQFESKTPGHPELGMTPGVDISTGPLGQGIANAVGFAIAEAKLAQKFNRPGFPIVDHYTYVLHGDGCLMEGISYEAASLAGKLGLGKLIMLYDSNQITIEGSTDLAFQEDIKKRFESMGWEYLLVSDGNDVEAISAAIATAQKSTDKPTIIEVKTTIGYGCKRVEGQAKAHGAPLGAEGMVELYRNLGYEGRTAFTVSDEIYEELSSKIQQLNQLEPQWSELLRNYKESYPELGAEFDQWMQGSADLAITLEEGTATRVSGGKALNAVFQAMPSLLGGSADLAPSNNTEIKGSKYVDKGDFEGNNIHFGIREHAMGAIANGIAAHKGLRSFAATFLVFSDYMKPAIRMAALMELPTVFIFTHDSIGVGEDGPTHQPIDQLTMLRSIPGLTVFRPADSREVAAAYEYAFASKNRPTAIVLSRQNLELLAHSCSSSAKKGAYIVQDAEKPAVNLLATGSEVSLAIKASKLLSEEGIAARVISMPSMDVFESQAPEYKGKILSKSTPCVSIEAGTTFGWNRYADETIGIDSFGASAPGTKVFEHFGLTDRAIADRIKSFLD